MPSSNLNFNLELKRRISTITDTTNDEIIECSYEIEITVNLQNGTVQKFVEVVPSGKVRSCDWIQKATHSLAMVPRKKEEREEFQSKIQRYLESVNVLCERIYPNPGWRQIPGIGFRFVLFDRKRMTASAEFASATGCGIEKTLSTYKDGVVIIDDFKPAVNYTQQKELDKKLDQLVRFYGDRVEKVRMTEFGKGNQNLYFPIQGDVLLRWNWITMNMEQVLDRLKYLHDSYRKAYEFKVQRFNDNIAILLTTARIIADYAMARNFWCVSEVENFMRQSEAVLVSETFSMQERFYRRDRACYVMEALADLLLRKTYLVVTLTKESSCEQHTTYHDNDFIYITAEFLRKIINEYIRENDENCVILSKDELIDLLEHIVTLPKTKQG